ncbi:MAG: hypothetical protein GF418_09535 [Chitinivibrionales bacterium]|nr:hypothetical protein [Chitinivibrionales bacterium]MBD3395851.1 hypothetical protein [Chitinivibrionales bacterium]
MPRGLRRTGRNTIVKALHGGILIGILVAAGPASATVTFSISADKTRAAVGEQIILTARAVSTKKLDDIKPPSLQSTGDYTVARTSQNQSQSSSVTLVNGKMVQKVEVTYLFYYFIVPKKPGAFRIPPLKLVADSKTYSAQPITITATDKPVVNPDMRVSLRDAKDRLYVGEQGILTFEVAQKPNAPVKPTSQGFTAAVEAIDDACAAAFSCSHLFADRITHNQKRIGGEMYIVFSLRFSIIPLKPGSFSIGPVPFEYQQLERGRRDPFDDFFGGFFGGGIRATPETALTNTVTITAVALPPPPRDFSGAVGTFSLDASVDPRELPAGEPATLSITLRGSTRPGNMGDHTLPSLDGFEVFSPEKHTHVDTTAQGIKTRQTYKYLIVPQVEGTQPVGPLTWVYFDPDAGMYKTLTGKLPEITVTRGTKATGGRTRYLTQEEIREVGSDIRYIKTPPKLRHQSDKPYQNPLFFILYPLPFVFALFSFLYKRQARLRERDAARILSSRAYRTALKRLDRLGKEAGSLSPRDAAARQYDILEDYLTQRFGFAAAGKTLDELRAEFAARGADGPAASEMVGFIEELDTVRFAPSVPAGDAVRNLHKARAVVAGLEKQIKARRRS